MGKLKVSKINYPGHMQNGYLGRKAVQQNRFHFKVALEYARSKFKSQEEDLNHNLFGHHCCVEPCSGE